MKNKKKILYVASSTVHINNFHIPYIKALRAQGHEVLVMASGSDADYDIPFKKRLLSLKNGECRRKIRKIIYEDGFDVVILNTSLAAFHVRLALRARKRPRVVNIVHGYLFSRHTNPLKRVLFLLAERLVRAKTDAIITMNRDDLDIARDNRLCAGKVYFSRGMGVSLRDSITDPQKIREELFPDGAFLMTFVGELSARKNQRFLVEALAKLKWKIPEAHLCLVGDGDAREEITELATSLGVSDSVSLVGSRRDACDFIRATDLYVSASVIEGLPFNIIEALGAEKTVLASDIKGQNDILEHGVDGYLYELGNIDDFVNKTCLIRENNAVSSEKIREKFLKYEKNSVFPQTLSMMKEAAGIADDDDVY